MGRSFDDVKKPDDEERYGSFARTHPPKTNGTGAYGFISIAETTSSANSSPSSGTYTSPESDGYAQEPIDDSIPRCNVVNTSVTESSSSEQTDNRLIHVSRDGPSVSYTSAPRGLVDPLFKDMSQASRFYLYHCMILSCTPVILLVVWNHLTS